MTVWYTEKSVFEAVPVNLSLIVQLTKANRLSIPKVIVDLTNLKEGDLVAAILTVVYKLKKQVTIS
jgi:hypothetical protein